jgi:hypothetical protein
MCETHGNHMMEKKQSLDAKCWKGKPKEGTKIKGDVRVNNCVPNESVEESGLQRYTGIKKYGKKGFEDLQKAGREGADEEEKGRIKDKYLKKEDVDEAAKKGLYYYVNKRKKAGTSRPASSPKAPTAQAWKDAAKTAKKEDMDEAGSAAQQAAIAINMKKHHKKPKNEDVYTEEELNLLFDSLEEMFDAMGIHEDNFDAFTDENILSEAAAWQKKSGKNKNGGLNKKGVNSYRREHPGSKLQTAVTTKPSKLKKGSKASKRRKSFCARMKGMKKSRTGAKTKRDPNSRINKSLRKWNC